MYFVSQWIHALTYPYIHWVDFFRHIFMETCFCSFLINFFNLLCGAAPALVVDASSSHVCTDEWHPTVSMLCPLSLPCKKSASGKSQLRWKQSSNGPSPKNFMTIGGCFKCYMYRVMALDWLKKEEDEQFWLWPFQVCNFKIVTTHCYYYCRLGQVL